MRKKIALISADNINYTFVYMTILVVKITALYLKKIFGCFVGLKKEYELNNICITFSAYQLETLINESVKKKK